MFSAVPSVLSSVDSEVSADGSVSSSLELEASVESLVSPLPDPEVSVAALVDPSPSDGPLEQPASAVATPAPAAVRKPRRDVSRDINHSWLGHH